MSDLQSGLISLGIVLIVVVLLFNWWQDWRVRRSMQKQFPEGEHDVLMNGAGARKEPALWTPKPAAADEALEIDPTSEAVIATVFRTAVQGTQLSAAICSVVRVGQKQEGVLEWTWGGE